MEALSSDNIETILIEEVEQRDALISLPNGPPAINLLEIPVNRIIKRTIDVVAGSILALIILPWLVPLVALLIKLDSRGPVFFFQERTGLNKKTFYCIKFRSMIVNKDANRLQVQPDDQRITRLGYFLRRLYIDEFPQLINVIKGDMSIVGPRPHMLRHTVVYARIISDYHERHRVRPGLTGLAQLRGYHGMIRKKEDLVNRISSDLEYIEKWSLLKDFRIIFSTLFIITKNPND